MAVELQSYIGVHCNHENHRKALTVNLRQHRYFANGNMRNGRMVNALRECLHARVRRLHVHGNNHRPHALPRNLA